MRGPDSILGRIAYTMGSRGIQERAGGSRRAPGWRRAARLPRWRIRKIGRAPFPGHAAKNPVQGLLGNSLSTGHLLALFGLKLRQDLFGFVPLLSIRIELHELLYSIDRFRDIAFFFINLGGQEI